jgi:AcrR family transcriptional regulator
LERHLDKVELDHAKCVFLVATIDPCHRNTISAEARVPARAKPALSQGDSAMNDEQGEARIRAKRDIILARAIDAFAENGFQNADVQMIAEKAGVGYGTVYRYFRTKEELFWSATYVVLERLGAHVRESIGDCRGAIETLRAAGLAYAGFFEANPECLAVFVESRAEFHGCIPASHRKFHEEMVQSFVEILERGIADGEIRRLDARIAVISLGCVLYGAVIFGCYVKDQFRLSELAEQALGIFLGGIRVEPSTGEAVSGPL